MQFRGLSGGYRPRTVQVCAAVPRFVLEKTRLDGPVLLSPSVFGDDRGFFAETYRANELAELGIVEAMVQDNHSRSRRGTIRGMHFHIGDGCSKLVRCGRGSIVDVLVDLRRQSPTYRQWEAFELSDDNMRLLYAPVGFGHGFVVLSDVADVLYKQSAYYDPEIERGISFMDPALGIDWRLPRGEWVYSERDAQAPTLAEFEDQLPFLHQRFSATRGPSRTNAQQPSAKIPSIKPIGTAERQPMR